MNNLNNACIALLNELENQLSIIYDFIKDINNSEDASETLTLVEKLQEIINTMKMQYDNER